MAVSAAPAGTLFQVESCHRPSLRPESAYHEAATASGVALVAIGGFRSLHSRTVPDQEFEPDVMLTTGDAFAFKTLDEFLCRQSTDGIPG